MIAMLGLALLTTPILATILFAPLAFGTGVVEPSLQSIISRFGTERTRGQLLGTYQSARSLAFILGPIWAGYVFQTINPQSVYSISAILVLVAAILAVLLNRQVLPSTHMASRPEMVLQQVPLADEVPPVIQETR
jgi:DHA1 family tetracycline resistance protein-like MFS transporter